MWLVYINFSANYKNISTELRNSTLYLSPSLFIIIPDGTYSINDINNSILTTPISGFYYKLRLNHTTPQYDVFRYNNLSDWQSNLNGVNQNAPITNLNSLNYKLSQWPNLLEAFKVRCNLFDIHENNSTSFWLTNELIIPIASSTYCRNHFEFNDIVFDNKLNQSCEV